MLVRNFERIVDSIDDMPNLPERRRFVVIYKYPEGPHRTMFEVYTGNTYDLYVINTSTIIGTGYIIPKGLTVQFKNTYRGSVIYPFNPDGSINLGADCIFNNVNYSTRIVNGKDILRANKKELANNESFGNYLTHILKSELFAPLPTYFNMEDQARLAKGDDRDRNFEILPQYVDEVAHKLSDFRDKKTTYITLDIQEDNLLQNQENIKHIIFPFNYVEEKNWVLDLVRDQFMSGFLDCYDIVMKSIFARAYIIFDIESGIFSIDKETLTLKHSYNITKEEVSKEYALMVMDVAPISDNLSDVLTSDQGYYMDEIPSRVTFYISPALCRMRFSIPEKQKVVGPLTGESAYSASDVDESSLAKEFGESMYLSEYYDEYGEYGLEHPSEE
jgi:hypothetical protein